METTFQQSWAGPLFVASSSSAPSTSSSPPPSSSHPSPSSPPSLHVHLLSGEDAEAPLLAAAAAVAVARKEEESKKVAAAAAVAGDGAKTDAAPASPPTSLPSKPREEEGDMPPSSSCSSSSSARELDTALAATRFGGASAARPQVCLCYGRGGALTLAGFPAWGLAQSEVYSMGPLREATRRGVREAAERFVSTAQRFGR